MGVVKRSVSFDADVWEQLTEQAGTGAVSPMVNDALALYLRQQRSLAAVAAFEAEHGAFTDGELAEADRVLDAAGVLDLRVAEPPPTPRARRAAAKPRRRARR